MTLALSSLWAITLDHSLWDARSSSQPPVARLPASSATLR
ncbi:hypothetical protein [Enterobacter phage 03_vB_Eclo_IJM]|nr:hypothetical protein [Enterobacter phage 03_vB_Eclo_IJM]